MGFKYLIGVLFFYSLSSFAQVFSSSEIQALKTTIYNSTQTHHIAEGSSKFSGSFDWHSDVHAHWALLSIARVTGDAGLDAKMQSILTIERIQLEYKFLSSLSWKNFEKPYGRAWFLLMLYELSQRPIGQDPRFQKIRYAMTAEIIKWLETNMFPEAGSSFIGTHDSWLMTLFLAKTASRDFSDIEEVLTRLIDKKLFPVVSALDSREIEHDDFIFLPALRQLVVSEPIYNGDTLPIPQPKQFFCHYPGAIQISMWAVANECAKNDAKSCDILQKQNAEFFSRKDLWQSDFRCVSHWVPQFMWMTHWLSLGTP